jgi:hypothetical protein
MPTMIMKIVSIASLLTAVLWSGSHDYRALLSFVITVSAVAVIVQASRAGKRSWVIVFTIIATFLNPALTGSLPRHLYLWIDLTCAAVFIASLIMLKSKPLLSIASITDRTPGSESL